MAQDDNKSTDASTLTFYPAFCFRASPTHFTWVKMTAADVCRLQRRRGFEGQNLFFYRNHPIQFVCVAGIVVACEEYERRTLLVLDDSSGATIEIVILKAAAPVADRRSNQDGRTGASDLVHVTSTARTPLENVDVKQLTLGAVIKVKGTLSSFRHNMQVILERVVFLRETNAEVRFWDERARFRVDVLSVPWALTAEQVAELRRQGELDEEKGHRNRQRAVERQKRLVEREGKHARRIQRHWEREEKMREKEAAVITEANRKIIRR